MLVIGLDVGTTGTKAIVCDEKGKILGIGYKEFELICDRAGFVSQKAADWWAGSGRNPSAWTGPRAK